MLRYLKNKYILTVVLFVVWILLFDEASVWEWATQRIENKSIQEEIKFYDAEYIQINSLLRNMRTNNDTLEKYVRESFYMKKPNEIIFLVE